MSGALLVEEGVVQHLLDVHAVLRLSIKNSEDEVLCGLGHFYIFREHHLLVDLRQAISTIFAMSA